MRTLLMAAVLLVGCGGVQRYTWSSDAGRQCFSQCQHGFYDCRTSCRGNGFCVGGCQTEVESCYDGCPDVQHVVVSHCHFGGCQYQGAPASAATAFKR